MGRGRGIHEMGQGSELRRPLLAASEASNSPNRHRPQAAFLRTSESRQHPVGCSLASDGAGLRITPTPLAANESPNSPNPHRPQAAFLRTRNTETPSVGCSLASDGAGLRFTPTPLAANESPNSPNPHRPQAAFLQSTPPIEPPTNLRNNPTHIGRTAWRRARPICEATLQSCPKGR